jgi:hypothetical protein
VIDYRFAPNKTIEQDLLDKHLYLGLRTQLTSKSNLLSEKIAEDPLVLVTSSQIKSISWDSLIEMGFMSQPDAALHAIQLLTENFTELEHIEQFYCK